MNDVPNSTLTDKGFRVRLGQWLRSVFGPLEQQPEEPPGQLSLRRDLPDPINVPAREYVYHFRVYPTFIWTSEDLHLEELDAWSQQFTSRARHDLGRIAANVSRNHAAHRPRAFEVELNRVLAGTPLTYERSGVHLTCQGTTCVRLDSRVSDYLRPFWEQRIKMEAEHDLRVRRAELVDQLNQRWLAIFDRLKQGPPTQAAARLTDKEFAEVVRELAAERKAAVDQLMQFAEQYQGGAASAFGQYEFAETFDRLNDALREQAGLGTNGKSNGHH